MKTTQNTVLITGGSAGIGFAIAQLLDQKGNHVIITGRDENRLKNAAARLKNATAIVSDVSQVKDRTMLAKRIKAEFPQLNLLVNNAGKAFKYDPSEEGVTGAAYGGQEMDTNYLAVINLTEQLLPLLSKQQEADIVNVSSVAAIVPDHRLPTYSATKAALHSYSQSLRLYLQKRNNVKVFELMPPLVNTASAKEIGGENGILPSVVAEEFLKAFEVNQYEIHVGLTADLYNLYLSSPEKAFQAMNGVH